jgi:hypothetical protein
MPSTDFMNDFLPVPTGLRFPEEFSLHFVDLETGDSEAQFARNLVWLDKIFFCK